MKMTPPSQRDLNLATQEVIAQAKRRFGFNLQPAKMAFMGRHELTNLIDLDVAEGIPNAVSENHHLRWCLGLTCGVRPGSVGWTKGRPDNYMRWKDINIGRGAVKGAFIAEISFRHLKGREEAPMLEPLTFTVR